MAEFTLIGFCQVEHRANICNGHLSGLNANGLNNQYHLWKSKVEGSLFDKRNCYHKDIINANLKVYFEYKNILKEQIFTNIY